MRGLLQLGQQLVGAAPAAASEARKPGWPKHGPQRPGEVALGQFVRVARGPRVVRRAGQQQAGGRVEQARRRPVPSATELRRTSAASSAARAASSPVVQPVSRPARQDT